MTAQSVTDAVSWEDSAVQELMKRCRHDPLRFVQTMFPWGSGELRDHPGPDDWQRDILRSIGEELRGEQPASYTGASNRVQAGKPARPTVRVAIASGHGVGKSALVSWLILWSLMTCPETRGVVTANTERQLRTKTWAEVGKWQRLMTVQGLLRYRATALTADDQAYQATWRIDMVPWNERRTEAFAGLHNHGRRVVLFFDEASAIADSVWETAEGALTDGDTEILWLVCGNPTRNTGRFKQCFHRFRHRWTRRQIDSRSARLTDKSLIGTWVSDYGEDSDFVRVRVRGVFPRQGANQFIATSVIEEAQARKLSVENSAPRVLGVDVARFGEDQTVLMLRQGRCILHIERFRKRDTVDVANLVAQAMERWRPDGVFIDGGGVGGGVIDNLRRLNRPVVEVLFGARALKDTEYANRRAEMWGEMRKWLAGASLPDDRELMDDLAGPEYGFVRENVIALERKKDMKARGLNSPDCADALALTFAQPVRARQVAGGDGQFSADSAWGVLE